jgi:hypothetical protein
MTPSNEGIAAGKAVGGGRYILNKQLGDNQSFWLAQDEIERRPLVLKFLPAELHQDPRGMEELRNQIATATQISHPNIAGIYGLYEAEGQTPFIIAEYVEGMNLPALQSMQPQRVFTWVFLAPLLKQLLAALQYVHEKGLVQGSLKPSNVMLDRKGQIKILDIGIAGLLNNPLYGAPPTLMPYLSPQQVDGGSPQVTDDVYSLGVVVYEFLTSTVPFYSGDILPQIRDTPASPIQQRLIQLKIANQIPQIVTSIVMSCLEKTPSARPQNIETISNSVSIAEVEVQAPQPAPVAQAPAPRATVPATPRPAFNDSVAAPAGVPAAAPTKSKPPILALAVVLVVAVAVAGGTVFFLSQKGKEPQVQPQAQAPVVKPETQAPKPLKVAQNPPPTETKVVPPPAKPVVVETPAPDPAMKKVARDSAELGRLASRSESGFVNLFNGQDLTGWTYDPTYWSVEQGSITGRAGSGAPPNLKTALVSQQGTVEDFELRLQYRFRKMAGNTGATAGIEYRGVKTGEWNISGYHYEITLAGDATGMLNSRERPALAVFTQKAFVRARSGGQDKIDTSSALEPFSTIASTIKAEDWNEVVITAQSNRLIHKINNHVVADVTDENDKKRVLSGLLALELNTGAKPGVFIQFKNIRLKKLK